MSKDFFSARRVQAGRVARPCAMCRGVIEVGAEQVSVSQRAGWRLIGYRLHVRCADDAGVLPAPGEIFKRDEEASACV